MRAKLQQTGMRFHQLPQGHLRHQAMTWQTLIILRGR